MREALDGRVHEARVPEVLQPHGGHVGAVARGVVRRLSLQRRPADARPELGVRRGPSRLILAASECWRRALEESSKAKTNRDEFRSADGPVVVGRRDGRRPLRERRPPLLLLVPPTGAAAPGGRLGAVRREARRRRRVPLVPLRRELIEADLHLGGHPKRRGAQRGAVLDINRRHFGDVRGHQSPRPGLRGLATSRRRRDSSPRTSRVATSPRLVFAE